MSRRSGQCSSRGCSARGGAGGIASDAGDSGGGVFVKNGSEWVLAGLLHAIDPYPTPQNDIASAFYNPTMDGSLTSDTNPFAARTYISDLSQYAGQINAVTFVAVAPEPGSLCAVSILVGAGLMRRRRSRP